MHLFTHEQQKNKLQSIPLLRHPLHSSRLYHSPFMIPLYSVGKVNSDITFDNTNIAPHDFDTRTKALDTTTHR